MAIGRRCSRTIELSWEIERYRVLRRKVLERYRQHAIEQGLRQIDLAGFPSNLQDVARRHLQRNANSWRTDLDAAPEIETRLAVYGLDQQAINAETYVQAREVFVFFRALLDAAQHRRASLLREIKTQRSVNVSPRSVAR